MTSMNILKKYKNDNYNTPKYAWDILFKFLELDKNTIIYDPFFNDNSSKTYMNELGYNNVIHEQEDFYKNYNKYNYDILISNPPFSQKQKILSLLYKLNKKFVLILPVSVISKLYLRNIFNEDIDKITYIIPNRRLQFEINNTNQKRTPFDTIYLCYNLSLKKDIIYL